MYSAWCCRAASHDCSGTVQGMPLQIKAARLRDCSGTAQGMPLQIEAARPHDGAEVMLFRYAPIGLSLTLLTAALLVGCSFSLCLTLLTAALLIGFSYSLSLTLLTGALFVECSDIVLV